MNRILLYLCIALAVISCKQKVNPDEKIPSSSATIDSISKVVSDNTKSPFDINKIPVSDKNIGKFPYLNAPEGYRYNDFTKSDLETLHYAVDGQLIPVEGKTYKSNIYKNNENESPFNVELVSRAYDKVIGELGGVKVSTKIQPSEIKKISETVLDKENHSYMITGVNDFTLNNVNTYVIRTAQSEVWVELSFWENGGYINILQKENVETPIVSIIK